MKYNEVKYQGTWISSFAECEFDKNGNVLSCFAMTDAQAREIAKEFASHTELSHSLAPRFGGDWAYTSW